MQTDTAYKPFVPTFSEQEAAAGATAPEKPAKPSRPPKAAKTAKRPRRPAKKKAAILPAPKHVRPTRKKTAKKRRTSPTLAIVREKEQARTVSKRKTRVQKVDLDVALQIGAMLKPADLNLFGELRHQLNSVNKPTRRRVLAAIQKVFG